MRLRHLARAVRLRLKTAIQHTSSACRAVYVRNVGAHSSLLAVPAGDRLFPISISKMHKSQHNPPNVALERSGSIGAQPQGLSLVRILSELCSMDSFRTDSSFRGSEGAVSSLGLDRFSKAERLSAMDVKCAQMCLYCMFTLASCWDEWKFKGSSSAKSV